ncbi:aldo/keto reductase [Actinomadura sp. WMMB 499]|uniref:aldo/keto reductase n=1 Tax=Actinomadura sp. WMMB 499 TaxID=1219491 RepID=UPI001246F640|nr:aldo/keto reductase [Actinomadura sp. WMMB 499]QFG21913.1 aldo/keto reductase [Actinomadura sp. WMMB 499]
MTILGLGTYRCRDVGQAAEAAAAHGTPWIDTAPVYGAGAAQPALAGTLAAYPAIGVSTKVGYMTGRQADAAVRAGCLDVADAGHRYSIAPDYVAVQIEANRAELGRRRLDVLYLHNPESCSHYDPRRLHEAITAAFAVCEQAVEEGRITGYGVSTWAGLADGAFTVPGLLEAASAAAGGEHHLTAIQLPVSLVHLGAVQEALHGRGPLVQAGGAGLRIWASSPLHGAELVSLVGAELAHAIRPGLDPVQAALLVTSSVPAVHGVLLSASTAGHWLQAQEAVQLPPLNGDELARVCELLRA